MLQFLCLALMMAYVSAQTPYASCRNPDTITYLDIGGCTTSPCMLTRGTIYHTVSKFTSPTNSQSLHFYFYGLTTGAPLPIQMFDSCPRITPTCPLLSGGPTGFEFDFYIPTVAPAGAGTLFGIHIDQNFNAITCAVIDVMIV